MWLYHEIHFTATDPTHPRLRPLPTTRKVRYRFKAWQICTQYVIIEIVKKIHNNVRTDKIHTHTHTGPHNIQTFVVGVRWCVCTRIKWFTATTHVKK